MRRALAHSISATTSSAAVARWSRGRSARTIPILRSSSSGSRRSFSRHQVRSWARATEWKVPAATWSRIPSNRSLLRSSEAAFRVKVRASTRLGSSRPVRARQAIRWVSTRVLPDPAPAWMARGRASVVTAARCSSFNPLSSASASASSYASPCRSPGAGSKPGKPSTVFIGRTLARGHDHPEEPCRTLVSWSPLDPRPSIVSSLRPSMAYRMSWPT